MKSICFRSVLTAVICALAAAANAADTTWNGGDGDWSDETKWSNGVPDSEKSAGFSSVGGTISMGSEVRGMSSMDPMNNSSPMVWTAEAGGGLTVEGGDFCVGRVGHGTLVFDSGTYTLKGNLRPGWYKQSWNTNDPAATGLVEVVNATVNYPNIYLGTDMGYGILDIKGGTVTGRYVSIGEDYHTDSNTPSYGLLKIATGGKLDLSGNNMSIGANGIGELQLNGGTIDNVNYIGVGQNSTGVGRFIVNGGTVNMTANLNAGNGGSGYFELGNATVSPSGFYIGGALGKMGEAVVKSGGVLHNRSNDIELGRYGQGTLTITGGGSVYTLYWLKLCVNGSNTEDATLNLEDGGVYTGGSIGKGSGTGNAIVNFNGGILRQEADANGYQTLIQSNMGDVNVMRKGMIVDTALRNNDAYGNISGVGFLEKRGDYTLWVKNAVDLKRGVRVVGGTLTLEQGFVTETTAMTPIKEIYVAAGKSLDLKGNLAEKPTIYVESFTKDGVVQAPGEYDDYNATIIVIAGGNTVATATWTGDAGDGDTANCDNWECYNADGVLLFDAVPPAATTATLTVPYDGLSLTAFRAIQTAFPNATCILDVSGTKTLNVAPAVVADALAWYDASDAATVTLNESSQMTKVSNKGKAGSSLDLGQSIELNNHPASYGTTGDFLQNGRNVFAFTNSYGLISANAAGIASDSPLTMMVLATPKRDTYLNSNGEGFYNQLFPMGLEVAAWNGASSFRLENWGGNYRFLYWDDSSERDAWFDPSDEAWYLWNFGNDGAGNLTVQYCDTEGYVTTATTATSAGLDGTGSFANNKVCLGGRFGNHATSAGNIGEAFVFDKALSVDELAAMRDYIRAKWFGVGTGVGNVALTANAVFDLDKYSVSLDSVSGSGVISNGTVTAIGTLNIVVNSDGTANKVVIPNGLDVTGMKVNITGIGNLKQGQPVIVLEAATGALTGKIESADVMIDVEGFRYRLKVNADGKLELAKSSGFIMIVR